MSVFEAPRVIRAAQRGDVSMKSSLNSGSKYGCVPHREKRQTRSGACASAISNAIASDIPSAYSTELTPEHLQARTTPGPLEGPGISRSSSKLRSLSLGILSPFRGSNKNVIAPTSLWPRSNAIVTTNLCLPLLPSGNSPSVPL